MLLSMKLSLPQRRKRHVAHDNDAPDVGHLDRAAVHAVRRGSSAEPVPLASDHQGRSRLPWSMQSRSEQMHVQVDE
jgi:hypothetical protein